MRATLMLAAAVSIHAGAQQAIVYVLAAAISLVATPAEPAFAGLMPQLATTPAELTAANVASSAIQSAGFSSVQLSAAFCSSWPDSERRSP